MQKFEVGQQVVCITRDWKPSDPSCANLPSPKYNDIVTVSGYPDMFFLSYASVAISLKEYGETMFAEICFAPILEDINELTEVLEETITV